MVRQSWTFMRSTSGRGRLSGRSTTLAVSCRWQIGAAGKVAGASADAALADAGGASAGCVRFLPGCPSLDPPRLKANNKHETVVRTTRRIAVSTLDKSAIDHLRCHQGVGERGPVPGPSPLTRKPSVQRLLGTIGSPTTTFSGKINSKVGARYCPLERPLAAGTRSKQRTFTFGSLTTGMAVLILAGSQSDRVTTRTERVGEVRMPGVALLARSRARPGVASVNWVVMPPSMM